MGLAACVAASLVVACAGRAPRSAVQTDAAISATDLRRRLFVFADDSMEGRASGTAGNFKGTRYIAGEAQRLGLLPAGDDGTYFQTIPLATWRLDTTSALALDGELLSWGRDYLMVNLGGDSWNRWGSTFVARAGVQAIYGGRVGDTIAALTDAQARGKLLVLSAMRHTDLDLPWRYLDRFPSAAAFVVVTPTLGALEDWHFDRRRGMSASDSASAAGRGRVGPPCLLVSDATAARLLGAPVPALRPGVLGHARLSGTVRFVEEPPPAPARNVVAIWPGSDPRLKAEYVALGAHNDHIGVEARAADHDSIRAYSAALYRLGATYFDDPIVDSAHRAAIHVNVDSLRRIHPARRDSINNGADDDGSGSVSLLEIAQAFTHVGVHPRRSVLFVWHTGEEMGMLGSTYFTDHPTVPRDSIVAQLNIDMIGRGDSADIAGGGPNYLAIVGSRRLSTELGDVVEAVNATQPTPLALDYRLDVDGHPEHIYCRSDHMEYARYGIPIVFFTTGSHKDYHQVTDEPQYIDYPHMARIDQLVYDIARRIADLDHRLVVDKPRPDPKALCVQ